MPDEEEEEEDDDGGGDDDGVSTSGAGVDDTIEGPVGDVLPS